MFNQILPRQVDNTYGGYKLALWLFGLLVLMKAGISLHYLQRLRCGEFRRRDPPGHVHARRRTGRSFSFRTLGALPAHDLLALCFGAGPISRNGPLHVCAALAGASR